MLIIGSQLSATARAEVLNRFVHRMTHEARQRWPKVAARMIADGYSLPPQSDDDWLAAHAFYVRADGSLDARYRHCEPACLA